MRDRSLVAFTLLGQFAAGTLWVALAMRALPFSEMDAATADVLARQATWVVAAAMVASLAASLFHLGTRGNAWRAVSNLRESWLSREIACAVLLTALALLAVVLLFWGTEASAWREFVLGAAAPVGAALVWCMASAYRLRTVPAWNTPLIFVLFLTTAVLLGMLAVSALLIIDLGSIPQASRALLPRTVFSALAVMIVEWFLVRLWLARLKQGTPAAVRAAERVSFKQGSSFYSRWLLALAGICIMGVAASSGLDGIVQAVAAGLGFGLVLASEVLLRGAFYRARVREGV